MTHEQPIINTQILHVYLLGSFKQPIKSLGDTQTDNHFQHDLLHLHVTEAITCGVRHYYGSHRSVDHVYSSCKTATLLVNTTTSMSSVLVLCCSSLCHSFSSSARCCRVSLGLLGRANRLALAAAAPPTSLFALPTSLETLQLKTTKLVGTTIGKLWLQIDCTISAAEGKREKPFNTRMRKLVWRRGNGE